MNNRSAELGTIVSGSLSEGFLMRINPLYGLENIKSGRLVSIQTQGVTFFSLITDIRLDPLPQQTLMPYIQPDTRISKILQTKLCSAHALIRPLIGLTSNKSRQPITSIPEHFARVFPTNNTDIAHIFGSETQAPLRDFAIGKPLDMEADVCIDLEKLTERSSGVFGKTGTGKTFITRLILAGLLKKNLATTLIFDMHSEYGIQARNESTNTPFVKGLKTLFPSKIAIFSLDPETTRRRGGSPDVCISLPLDSIHVQDILALSGELNLHATAYEAAYLLAARFKKDWLLVLLERGSQAAELAQEIGAHPESISALYRKLRIIDRYPFFAKNSTNNPIQTLLDYLDRGISVVIEFGTFSSTFTYLLLANIITRRIHAQYVEKTERFLASQKKEDAPKQLVVVIEEAHKFLNPAAAHQTIFGTIAREMRKYYVSLMVVDQRPSGIDEEILSQIGTKIIAQLHDEKDIAAVLAGVSGGRELKNILTTLSSKQQALILGHAITTPIVLETRAYDQVFYHQMQENTTKTEHLASQLFN